ncbi:hypothetical protein CRE_31413 [Caenorhabditis remanei]|uniref:Uncharacterized protein n=1 Tax=Caenorhabditis remanei TaxID=31234 RepID=E3N5U0_CAERE|nr:hypothetical protein CRE_31413 [Caenorhabditis remanei]
MGNTLTRFYRRRRTPDENCEPLIEEDEEEEEEEEEEKVRPKGNTKFKEANALLTSMYKTMTFDTPPDYGYQSRMCREGRWDGHVFPEQQSRHIPFHGLNKYRFGAEKLLTDRGGHLSAVEAELERITKKYQETVDNIHSAAKKVAESYKPVVIESSRGTNVKDVVEAFDNQVKLMARHYETFFRYSQYNLDEHVVERKEIAFRGYCALSTLWDLVMSMSKQLNVDVRKIENSTFLVVETARDLLTHYYKTFPNLTQQEREKALSMKYDMDYHLLQSMTRNGPLFYKKVEKTNNVSSQCNLEPTLVDNKFEIELMREGLKKQQMDLDALREKREKEDEEHQQSYWE